MSNIVREITGYPTSTDHGELWEMAQRQSVVCLVGYGNCLDVAQTLAIGGCEDGCQIHISCRGTGYVQGWNKVDFIEQCQKAKVQWLVPSEPTPCD